MHRTTVLVATLSLLAGLGWGSASFAVTAGDISDEAFATFFNDLAPGIGGQGMPYAPTAMQNPIGSIATFAVPGIVSFMNSPPYYIFPTSPLSLGFASAQSMDITFSTAMSSISIGARGTRTGTSTGPSALGNPFPPSVALVDAISSVSALDQLGNVIDRSTTPIGNLDMDLAPEITFAAVSFAEPIYGLRFEQTVDSPVAGLMVGGLGLTPIPEPGTGLLVGLGLAGWSMGRRRPRD